MFKLIKQINDTNVDNELMDEGIVLTIMSLASVNEKEYNDDSDMDVCDAGCVRSMYLE